MKKKIIVAAVAAAMVAPMAAMADATVYGKIRVATQYHDRDATNADAWGLVDHSSRLGIKGSEDLGNGLKAVYKMEFGVNVGEGYGKSSFWSQRNSYVGLAGGWGTFLVGKHDTPFKISSGKLDFFADTAADYDGSSLGVAGSGKGVGLFHSLRVDGAIAYISPSMAGFTVAGAIVQTNVKGGFEDADDFMSAYSLAAMYSNGPFFGSLAYENIDPQSLVGAPAGASDFSKWRLGLGVLGMSGFSASFIYEDRSDYDFAGLDGDSWQIQGAYDFGNNRVKAMYGELDWDGTGSGGYDSWAIGLAHSFSKRTSAEVLYRQADADNTSGEDDVFALQLNHSF